MEDRVNAFKKPALDETLGSFYGLSLNHLAHVLKPKQVFVIDTHRHTSTRISRHSGGAKYSNRARNHPYA